MEVLRHLPQEATLPTPKEGVLAPTTASPVPVPCSPELWSSWRRAERLLSCWGLSSGSPRP